AGAHRGPLGGEVDLALEDEEAFLLARVHVQGRSAARRYLRLDHGVAALGARAGAKTPVDVARHSHGPTLARPDHGHLSSGLRHHPSPVGAYGKRMPLSASSCRAVSLFCRCSSRIARSTSGALVNWMSRYST